MRNQAIEAISNEKLIVIVRGVDREQLIPLAETLYRGGLRLLEITYDATGKVSDEYMAESLGILVKHFEGRGMYFGSGTVLTERQVELTAKAGGAFIISPDVNVDVIKKTRELGLVSIPGALTPSEATAANRAGADFVKLFPVTTMGTSYIKAIRAPLSHIKFLAVGGVNPDNVKDFMATGISGVGVGGGLANAQMVKDGKLDEIEALARTYVERLK